MGKARREDGENTTLCADGTVHARFIDSKNNCSRDDFLSRVKDELEGEYYETFVVSNSRGPASEAIHTISLHCHH